MEHARGEYIAPEVGTPDWLSGFALPTAQTSLLVSEKGLVARQPAFSIQFPIFTRQNRFVEVADTELPSDPASRRGRLVYRRPRFASGGPFGQNPCGLAISGFGLLRSRVETLSEPTGSDAKFLGISAASGRFRRCSK